MGKPIWFWFVVAILSLMGFQIVQLDLLKHIDIGIPLDWHCEASFQDQVMAAEDITMVVPGVFLASSDDRLRLWEHPSFGPSKTPDGGVLAIYGPDREGEFQVERLELEGFPWATVAFHPHGIFFHRPSSMLYTINHAYMKGGERIEVFKVTLGADQKVSLRYERSVRSPLFDTEAMGNLNDLVVLGEEGQEEIYVTHYRAFPDGAEGRLSSSIVARTHDLLTLLGMLAQRRWTRVLYCKGSDCRVAAGEDNGGIAFNGITLSPDNRRLVVADTKSIVVFEITGPGSLRRAQLLRLPHFIDNIEPSVSPEGHETYTMASIGYVYEFLHHNGAYAKQPLGDRPSAVPPVAGGAMRLTRDPITGLYSAADLLMTDGKALSLISSAVQAGPSHLLMGAWGSRGLLICRMPGASSAAAPPREGRGGAEL